MPKPPRFALSMQRELTCERRDERRAHRALSKEISDQIGNSERDDERVHVVAGAEQRGEDLIAHEAEDATRKRGHSSQAGGSGERDFCDGLIAEHGKS